MVFQLLAGLICGCASGIWFMSKHPESLSQIQRLQRVFEVENQKRKEAYWSPWARSWWQTVQFVGEVMWTSLEQYLCGTCVAIPGTSHYRITFTLENRLYRLLVRPVRGPRQTAYLFASTMNDGSLESLTEHVVPYAYGLQSIVRPLTARALGFSRPVTRFGEDDDVHTLGVDESLLPAD